MECATIGQAMSDIIIPIESKKEHLQTRQAALPTAALSTSFETQADTGALPPYKTSDARAEKKRRGPFGIFGAAMSGTTRSSEGLDPRRRGRKLAGNKDCR